MRQGFKWVVLVSLLLLMTTVQAAGMRQRGKLEQSQAALAAAIRWGDFETAWQLVDPAYKEVHPLTDFQLQRYEQVQISGYRDLNSSVNPDGVVIRNVELRIINKHTMAERSLRYQERWRWDAGNKTWWLAVGLPDLWDGQ